MGVFRLNGQSKRDDGMIFGSCKASQSPVYPIRDAFLAVNHASCPSLSSSGPRQWGENRIEDKPTPWSALPLGKIVVIPSLSLAPAITGRYDPTLPGTTVEEPTPRTTERFNRRECRTRRPPILISLTCTLRSDQCLTALGRHNRRRKFPRLYARMNRDRRTRLATNRWHDSRVQFSAYFPSLIHCSAVPRPL